MNKFYTISLFIFIGVIANAQHINYAYDSKEIQGIQKGTIYVVPTGDKTFDDSLKTAVEQYWKISPSKVLSKEEVEKYLGDENNYFIAPSNGFDTQFKAPAIIASPLQNKNVRELMLFHGGKHKKKLEMNYQWPISYCFFVFYLPNATSVEYGANGLGFAVKNLNDNVDFVISKKIDPIIHITGDYKPDLMEEYSKNPKTLKNKILLIDNVYTKFLLKEKTMNTYKYKYLFAETSEIISFLNSDPKKYCVLTDCPVLAIYDNETKSLIWFDIGGKMSQKVTEKQIANLNVAIGKK